MNEDRVVFGAGNSGLDFIENYKAVRRRLNGGPKPVVIQQISTVEYATQKAKPKPYAPSSFGNAKEHLFPSKPPKHLRNDDDDFTDEDREILKLRADCVERNIKFRSEDGTFLRSLLSDRELAMIVRDLPADTTPAHYAASIVENRHGFSFEYFTKARKPEHRSKSPYETQAKQEFAWIMMDGFGWTTTRTAKFLGMDHSSMTHARKSYKKMQETGLWRSTQLAVENRSRDTDMKKRFWLGRWKHKQPQTEAVV